MSIKQKFESIDQSQLSENQKEILGKIKTATKDFTITDQKALEKVDGALDNIITKLKATNPQAIKGEAKKREPRAKKEVVKKEPKSETKKPKEAKKEAGGKRTIFSIAKEIRKADESWEDAKARAKKVMETEKVDTTKKMKSETDKLLSFIKRRKELEGLSGTSVKKDSKIEALPKGRRISKKGWKNQHGESEGGKVYYENRDNRTDRLAPNFDDKIYLEGGGYAGGGYVVIAKSEKGGGFVMSKPTTKAKAEKLKSLLPKIDGETNEVMTIGKASKLSGLVGKEYLKYADGGAIIGTPETPLARDLGISYTGLVGETGAMSSGEMFADGGSLTLTPETPLARGLGISYTGLVGETGAMSSGEMFDDGGFIDKYEVDRFKQVMNGKAIAKYIVRVEDSFKNKETYVFGIKIKDQFKGCELVPYESLFSDWGSSGTAFSVDNLQVKKLVPDSFTKIELDEEQTEMLVNKLVKNNVEGVKKFLNSSFFYLNYNQSFEDILKTHFQRSVVKVVSIEFEIMQKYEQGGGVGRVESLKKELFRLQRELNSSRLQTYRLGDVSQEAMDREKEREVKLARFNEILKVLRESDVKLEQGGSLVDGYLTDPNFGDFQAGVYADGGFMDGVYADGGSTGLPAGTEQHFVNYYLGEGTAQGIYADGGSTGLPAGTEQSYVNYYLGEGSAQGVYAQGGSLGNHGLKEGDQVLKTMSGGIQKVKTRSGDIVYVNLANGYRGAEPPLPFDDGGMFQEKMKWQDAEVGDSARVKEIDRMGLIVKAYGRKFHLRFPNGTEKTFDANELEFIEDNDDFKDGGKTRERRFVNHGQDYEVRYSKDKPKRRGYGYADGGTIDAFQMRTVRGVDSMPTEILTDEQKVEFEKGGGVGKSFREKRNEYLYKLAQKEGDVWDKISANSGADIRNSDKLLKAYAEGVDEMLQKEGVGKGSFDQEDYDYFTDENWHLFNEFLVWNSYYEPEMTKNEKAWREKMYEEQMREKGKSNYVSNPKIISLSGGSKSKSTNYVAKAKISTITIVKDGKEIVLSSKDVLNGVNLYDGGGKLKNDHTYFAKRYVKEVITEDGDKLKPSNGYWVKKSALKDSKKKVSLAKKPKFKVDDLVYNKRTKSVGIVRIEDERGETKTDADGNVNTSELQKYNPLKFKNQKDAKVSPSTQKEVDSRGLFNPFSVEKMSGGGNIAKKYNALSKEDKEELMREKVGIGRTPFSEYEKYSQLSSYHKEMVDKHLSTKKMATGGKTKRGGAMVLAKQIRKEGESWASALKRANEQMRNK